MRLGRRTFPVVLPALGDPRLHVAAIIVTLQVLGQTVLGFEVSVAQILVAVCTCAVIEVASTLRSQQAIVWPASALLTGNSVAFILRVTGTRHGDWWSTRGVWMFAAVAAVSLLSKQLIRFAHQHVFNPSNFGLVLGFMVFGTRRVNPQDLWWGHLSAGLAFTLAIIVIGGLSVAWRMQMLGMVVAFWLTFGSGMAVLAATGHCMTARWHVGPLCGATFWWAVVASPEVMVFLFFMITDPRTSPMTRAGRAAFGCLVGIVATLLVAPARTEFWTKVGILGGLLVVCALRPAIERASGQFFLTWGRPPAARAAGAAVAGAALIGGAVVLSGLPAHGPTGVISSRAGGRLAVTLPALPNATVDRAARAIDGSLDQRAADRMARDVVTDLLIAAEAMSRLQPALLREAGTGPWLARAQQDVAAAAASGVTTTTSFRVDRVEIIVLRDPQRAQAPPLMGVEVLGTVRQQVSRRDVHAADAVVSVVPFDRKFAVAPDGREFLIEDER